MMMALGWYLWMVPYSSGSFQSASFLFQLPSNQKPPTSP